uniref:Uncharacterized protein n=1 Tax=Rhizophagus irregularis (strain DAOM 181602 / DAOM 197198 / MUCL 43194) TaxID=747089 RepID=U9SLN5_RHIID
MSYFSFAYFHRIFEKSYITIAYFLSKFDNGNTSSTSSTNTNTQGISPSNSISPLLDNSSLEDTAAITTSTDNPLSQPVNKDFPDFQRRVHQRRARIQAEIMKKMKYLERISRLNIKLL